MSKTERLKASKNERFYFIRCPGEIIRFRNILRKKGKEIEPMIQMEVSEGSKWLEVIRCDRSHGVLHIDFIDKDGKRKYKKYLKRKNPIDAIAEVIDLLKREGKKLLEELHYDEIAGYFVSNQGFIKSELDNAKEFLLNEAEQLGKIEGVSGTSVASLPCDAYIKE